MRIECKFFATFREAVGSKTIEREIPDGATVGDALVALEAEFDGLEGQLLDDEGGVAPQLSVLKNGREVLHMEGVDTPLSAGDTLSVFPPVAGGREARTRCEKSYRGISERLAIHYLENLGGERVAEDAVEGAGWRATLSSEPVSVGASLSLTEVTVAFEGEEDVVPELVEQFTRKAMRAGG